MQNSADFFNYYLALNGYITIETDADSSATYMYYQYMNKQGNWYIMRSEMKSATQYEYKFCKGITDAASVWVLRSSQNYTFPNVAFKDL